MRRAAALALVAACGADAPCDAVTGACLELTVESALPDVAFDELEIGIAFPDTQRRATTRLDDASPFALPAIIAIGVPIGSPDPVVADLVVTGHVRSEPVGAAAASVVLTPDAVTPLTVRLVAREACVDGGRYCGGDRLLGNPAYLYTCSALGVPRLYQQCTAGCVVAPAGSDDYCR